MTYPIFKTVLLSTILIATFNPKKVVKEKKITLKVKLENVIVNKGEIYLALYNNDANFMHKYLMRAKIKAKNKSQLIAFNNLPEGDYSVTVFQDLNGNKVLDKFMSIPTEPYGISNNPSGFPTFSNSKINLKNNKTININIKN